MLDDYNIADTRSLLLVGKQYLNPTFNESYPSSYFQACKPPRTVVWLAQFRRRCTALRRSESWAIQQARTATLWVQGCERQSTAPKYSSPFHRCTSFLLAGGGYPLVFTSNSVDKRFESSEETTSATQDGCQLARRAVPHCALGPSLCRSGVHC